MYVIIFFQIVSFVIAGFIEVLVDSIGQIRRKRYTLGKKYDEQTKTLLLGIEIDDDEQSMIIAITIVKQ